MLAPATQPANTPAPGFDVFWRILGRIAFKLVSDRSHCDLVVQIRNGKVELVRLNSSYLPGGLPLV